MNHPQDSGSLGHTSPSSDPFSTELIWTSSMSPGPSAPPTVPIYPGHNPFFPPIQPQVASANAWQPYSSTPASSIDQPSPASNNNKVPIPRLAAPTAFHGRRRSARACEACRQRKIKCDGNRPACRQCVYHNQHCSYEDVKRVREQKQLELLTRRVGRYESLLRSLEGEVDAPTAARIRKALKVSIQLD